MKSLKHTIWFVLISVTAWAQPAGQTNRDGRGQDRLKAARIAFITERLELTPEEAERFWPVYREYTSKQQELRQQFESVRKNPDPKHTAEQHEKKVIEQHLQFKQKELDLEKEYSDKFLKVISAQKLMALKQAEVDFRRMVAQQIRQRELQQRRSQNPERQYRPDKKQEHRQRR